MLGVCLAQQPPPPLPALFCSELSSVLLLWVPSSTSVWSFLNELLGSVLWTGASWGDFHPAAFLLDSQGLSRGGSAGPKAVVRAYTWLPPPHCSHWDINGVPVAISGDPVNKISINTAFIGFLEKALLPGLRSTAGVCWNLHLWPQRVQVQ